MGILQVGLLEWAAMPSPPGDLPNPRIEPRSPALQVDSLLSEPPGKPKNTGVGSLSLLQGIFPTQELNWGLLHCRQILYQLSYERTPRELMSNFPCSVVTQPNQLINKCCSVAKLYLTLRDSVGCSTPGFPVLHYLLEFAQTHVIVSVMPPNHLVLYRPLLQPI